MDVHGSGRRGIRQSDIRRCSAMSFGLYMISIQRSVVTERPLVPCTLDRAHRSRGPPWPLEFKFKSKLTCFLPSSWPPSPASRFHPTSHQRWPRWTSQRGSLRYPLEMVNTHLSTSATIIQITDSARRTARARWSPSSTRQPL